jgi:hypothetical protein
MRLVIELPPELEASLSAQAADRGLPVEQYVLRLLSNALESTPSAASGAELVAYWQREQLIGTRPEITDVVSHSRKLREESQQRRRPQP